MWYDTLLELPEEGKAVLVLIALGTTIFAYVYILDRIIRRREERIAAMKRERLKELRSFAADALVNGIEDAIHEEKLSRQDGNYLYKKFSHQLALWDLYPRRLKPKVPDPTDLKEQIRERLKNGEYTSKLKLADKPKDDLEEFLLDGIKHAAM